MLCEIPKKYFFVAGSSEGYSRLNAFDAALIKAGVGNTNLVKVTSIIPPYAEEVEPIELPPGALVPTAYSVITSELEGEIISAAVAVAIPEDKSKPGIIMEYSSKGHKEDVERVVRKMAEEAMKIRGEEKIRIKSISVQHQVRRIGTAFAAVILWY